MASAETFSPVRSRRDEHKSRTKRALQTAALGLFASQGYDTTTTEEIAEQAGVATRTFFRYFPTKESVLFLDKRAWVQAFVEDYLTKPDSFSDIEAMRASFIEAAPGLARRRDNLRLWVQANASSATLRGRQHDRHHDDETIIAHAIATRRGLTQPDEPCTLLAAIGLLTHRRALDQWLTGPTRADLGAAITTEFKLLADQFTPH